MKSKAKSQGNKPQAQPVHRPQRGGTLLGLLIGVVLGLGIALGVAVYVTKVPIPFTSKGPTRNADQDAAEARKNKDWDPNAPLYGRNPARPVVPNPDPAATPSSGPEVATGGQRPLVAPAAAADPLGDLATARAAAVRTPAPVAAAPAAAPATPSAPAAASEAADPFSYFVQVGAFRAVEEAESQRARLSLGGIEARVSEREQSGRTVYRVRVGPFDKRGDADRTKDRLEALGMEAALVRVQR